MAVVQEEESIAVMTCPSGDLQPMTCPTGDEHNKEMRCTNKDSKHFNTLKLNFTPIYGAV